MGHILYGDPFDFRYCSHSQLYTREEVHIVRAPNVSTSLSLYIAQDGEESIPVSESSSAVESGEVRVEVFK